MCQVGLGKMDSDSAVGDGGDHLTHRLGTHVTHGKNTGDAGLGVFVGDDIAAFVQIKLSLHQSGSRLAPDADKKSVAGDLLLLTRLQIADGDGG